MTAKQEAGRPVARPGAREAFSLALKKFVNGDRLDMQDLAAELGVDRTTLFRWVGNRDTLVVNILTTLADPTIKKAAEAANGSGGARVARIAEIYAQKIIDASYYRAFMQREPERSLRLTTTKASPLQQHIVENFQNLLQQEREGGHEFPPMDLHDLAYLIVRIIESFIYADIITGEEPDSTKVGAAIAALLTTSPAR
ncbi:QsdR family transcriptional regulator [Streptomyces sp. NPDC056296]|uniref:QsdR family transcriptional regulator n=1 Tax=Streptomyces sp. NPDC056296 TaxID=3345775 RepID=UPI0035E032D9